MSLNAATLHGAFVTAAEEAKRLAPFINDLDGWDGSDCDTGSNAHHTLRAFADATNLAEGASFQSALEAAIEAGITYGVGHIGLILTSICANWSRALDDGISTMTPVRIRAMLQSSSDDVSTRITLSAAIEEMLSSAQQELTDIGDTLPEDVDVLSHFSTQTQVGLIEATNTRTGRIDAGGAVLALLFTCLDSAARSDTSMLESLTQMLADLASRSGNAPSPQAPPPGRDFTVDMVWQGNIVQFSSVIDRIDALGARVSYVGTVDLFGMGTWRIHADTSAPIAVIPRNGRTIRFQVADARPDAMIGVDELAAEGLSHRGVRLLERRPIQRVERACVIACTRAPGLVEDLARAGAIVFYDPHDEDAAGIWQLTAASSTGVSLFVPCDDASRRIGEQVALTLSRTDKADTSLLIADSRDDLSVLACAQSCGGLFIPQPGGPQSAPIVRAMLESQSRQALSNSLTLPLPGELNEESTLTVIDQIRGFSPTTWRVLLGRGAEGPLVVATIRQMLTFDHLSADVDVLDGGQPGPSLIQGLR